MNCELAKANTFILVTEGVYDDYFVRGLYLVLEDFNPQKTLESYVEMYPRQRKDGFFSGSEFVERLVDNGLLRKIKYSSMHLSNYSSYKEFEFEPVE